MEVTREVPVVREVPVTVEVIDTVEVTREVEVTRQVPVTVEVIRTVDTPVTREVVREIEITREVPVTRIVTPTPAPTVAPVPVPTPVPAAQPQRSRFGSWEMELQFHGNREVASFSNLAVAHETLPDAPVVTFLCDDRGYRSMHIDWRHPVVGVIETSLSPYSSDPFDLYSEVDARFLLADYARRLHAFVDGIRLSPQDAGRFRELWRQTQREYHLNKITTFDNLVDDLESDDREIDDEQADAAATDDEPIISANRGAALVQLDFSVEIPELIGQDRYRPSVRATVRSNWRVLPNQRTLMGDGPIGSINQSYETIAPPRSEADNLRIMTADIGEPEQPVALFAKWEITGLREVLEHCRDFRN